MSWAGGATRQRLPAAPDAPGRPRWFFQHGPIDLVVEVGGEPAAVQQALDAAWARFQPLLAELVHELPLLRAPVQAGANPVQNPLQNPLQGAVARRMWAACAPLHGATGLFITPMAAVAGAVADELLACCRRPGVRRAWVNNGGDTAFHLAPGEQLAVGLVADLGVLDAAALQRTVSGQARPDGQFVLHAGSPVRGLATSGWRGRSFSFGIADSVTVLADTAALADAAATLVANAVNIAHPGIVRRPANDLQDDTDLGCRLVTVDVPALGPARARQALDGGLRLAQVLQARGLIRAAWLVCQGQHVGLGPLPPLKYLNDDAARTQPAPQVASRPDSHPASHPA